LTEEVNKYAH
jgi:DNA primase large subunit